MIELSGIKYYSLQEVAQIFSVSKNTVSRWRREKKLKFLQLNKRKYYFSENNIKEYMKI